MLSFLSIAEKLQKKNYKQYTVWIEYACVWIMKTVFFKSASHDFSCVSEINWFVWQIYADAVFHCVTGMSVRGSRGWQLTAIPLSLLFIIALTAMRPTLWKGQVLHLTYWVEHLCSFRTNHESSVLKDFF